jgi:hypothetical protein
MQVFQFHFLIFNLLLLKVKGVFIYIFLYIHSSVHFILNEIIIKKVKYFINTISCYLTIHSIYQAKLLFYSITIITLLEYKYISHFHLLHYFFHFQIRIYSFFMKLILIYYNFCKL